MKRYFIISNLEWDTDGKKVKGLPDEFGLTVSEEDVEEWVENEMDQDKDEIDYWIMDWLTDYYEWCIAGCEIKEVSKEEMDEFMSTI